MTVDAPHRGLVLLVEDEPAIADLVRLYLARDGFGVHLERDGDAGLAAARRLRPVVCVLDIALPGLPGTEICRRLRGAGDWTPVIFLTARDDEVDRIVGLELGADDYVTKPFSPRELVARVQLTSTEFDLLAHLMARPGRVFTREELLAGVWGYAVPAGTRTVDVHVAQVRAKLGPESVIRTHRGVGYAVDA